MQVKKIILTTAAASVLGMASVVGATSTTSTSASLVDRIAQKFNVDKNEVQKVFDEDRASHQAEHEARYKERLTQAVKDGKLTAEQKSKLLAKHKELLAEMEKNHQSREAERQAFASKSEAERAALMEQRRTEMDKKRSEIETWEKANNIPSGYLMGGPGDGYGPGPGGLAGPH